MGPFKVLAKNSDRIKIDENGVPNKISTDQAKAFTGGESQGGSKEEEKADARETDGKEEVDATMTRTTFRRKMKTERRNKS